MRSLLGVRNFLSEITMKSFLSALAAVSAAAILAGCTNAPVHQAAEARVPASASAIHRAILHVAQTRRYDVVKDAPGAVTLAYPPRDSARSSTYQATYRVTYGNGNYRVDYQSSRGLNARPCQDDKTRVCGHRKLHQWQENLKQDIERELQAGR